MTSTIPSSSSPNNAAQSATGATISHSGSQQARFSYANATKSKPAGAPPIASSTPPAVVGGPAQHGKSNSVSPVNGKPAPPAVPTLGAPAIVSSASVANGSTTSGDGIKNPSSVTINAQGTTSYLPNGGSGAQPSRANIHFGAMNPSGSPAIAHSVPHNPQNSNLGTAPLNNTPRSPSPIPPPHPLVSGGRPPSAPQGPGSQLSFGNLGGGDSSDPSMRPSPHAPGPASLAQSQHLRRESSQSQHGDMSGPGPMNRNFNPGNGRGRGFQPGFQASNLSHSPQVYRGSPSMQSRNLSNVPAFQPQGMRGGPNSPYQATRSPAMASAALQQQPHMANGQHMPHGYGYLNPQNPAIYGVPPEQQYYNNYYGQPFIPPNMHGMPYGAPPSPRFNNAGHAPQQAYMPGPYQPPAHNMSRQSSHQGSDRPPSTVPQVSTPSAAQPPPVVSSSPAPPARTEPRKSKAIVIKSADGKIVDLKSISQSPAPAPTQNRPPAVVSSGAGVPSTSTPPPRPSTESTHKRTESIPPKAAEAVKPADAKSIQETQRQFAEQVKRQLQQEAGKKEADEKTVPVESTPKASDIVKPEEPKEEPKKKDAKAEEPTKEEQPAKTSGEDDAEAERKRKEDEDTEAWIREMEEQDRAEEERNRKYEEEKKRKAVEAAEKEKEAAAKKEEDLKKAEREAEEREAAKGADTEASAEAKALFAALKKPTLGPGAASSEASTPASEPMPPPPAPTPTSGVGTPKATIPTRPKPSMLKLETGKIVEPAQPTAGMQSLRSARFLKVQSEDNIYPGGIRSPNPALNQGGKSRGRQYDKDFLLQFQDVFKEKPTVDWDKMLKDTVGDSSDPQSARPQSARTPSMGGRQNSRNAGPAMGSFAAVGNRVLPAGTTSEQRFAASNSSAPRMGGTFTNPLAQFGAGGRGGLNFPMVAPPMSRTGSASSRGPQGNMNSPRSGSTRERSRRDRGGTAQEAQMAKTMPLTAGKDLKPLEVSKSGWKPASLVSNAPALPGPGSLMTPDIVQRKVKASLNKMTPEKFDKISGDILQIAAQSKDENDGRTLRQVIQLTFEKACDEAHWASMYAKFCKRMLETMSPDIKDENVKDKHGNPVVGGALFRKYLLNRCQEEFERGWEVNLPAKPEGQSEEATMLSDEYYVAAAAKRKGLGLIQFIGELYKLGMLTIRIMHDCVIKLLNSDGLPEETTIESLVKLLRTVGATMDSNQPHGHDMVSMYFGRIDDIMKMPGLPSRMYYMLLDMVELRKKNWDSKDNNKGPKTISEIREEAQAAELKRQQAARAGGRPQAGRGDARSFSGNMGGPPPDYHRNQVGIDDLKKLTRGARTNPSSGASLGPSSMLSNSRSGSRRGLGPPRADDSGPSSRTGTPPVKEKESAASVNAFSLLAETGDADNEVASPPSTSVSPALAKSTPASKDESKP